MKSNYYKYLLIVVLAIIFVLPGKFVHAQFSAGPSTCGISDEGLCKSSCGPYDEIANADTKCSIKDNEQCCIQTKCINNTSGLGECRKAANCGELTSKYTTDCNRDQVPASICCITPKITEITCPGGVCSDDNNFETNLNSSLSSICVEGFQSDFCDSYTVACGLNPNSTMCQQTIIDLTNNATVSACQKNPKLAECLTGTVACSQDPNSSECLNFVMPGTGPTGLVPASCTGFDKVTGKFNCSLCSLFELIKNIIDWLVGFTISISVGFIVWAGMQMMFSGGDSSAVTKARETATTAVYGVALALGGWLIIGTLLGALTGSEKIMPWNKITCTAKSMDIGGEATTQSATCTAAGGTCQNTSLALCGGTYKDGLCGGSNDIKCCVLATAPKIEMVNCSKVLNGAYTCTNSECPSYESLAGICSSGQHCCPKNSPTTPVAGLTTTECSGTCKSQVSCNSNEAQLNEICDLPKICCKQKINCSDTPGYACSQRCYDTGPGELKNGICSTGLKCCSNKR